MQPHEHCGGVQPFARSRSRWADPLGDAGFVMGSTGHLPAGK